MVLHNTSTSVSYVDPMKFTPEEEAFDIGNYIIVEAAPLNVATFFREDSSFAPLVFFDILCSTLIPIFHPMLLYLLFEQKVSHLRS